MALALLLHIHCRRTMPLRRHLCSLFSHRTSSVDSGAQTAVSFVSWFNFQHEQASTSCSRMTVVWDVLQQKPWTSFSDLLRRCSVLQWKREYSTQTIGVNDDSSLSLRVWNVRKTISPFKDFVRHMKGVTAMSWCLNDRSVLLCAMDNPNIFWDMSAAEIVRELPANKNWNFDNHWYPKVPRAMLTSSFDVKIGICDIQACSRLAAREGEFNASAWLKWLKWATDATFGCGGACVSFHPTASNSEDYLHNLVTKDSLVSSSVKSEAATYNGEKTSLIDLCDKSTRDLISEDEKDSESMDSQISLKPVSTSSEGMAMGVIRASGNAKTTLAKSLIAGSSATSAAVTGRSGDSLTKIEIACATLFRADVSAQGSYVQPITVESIKRRFSETLVQSATQREQPQTMHRDCAVDRRNLSRSCSSSGRDTMQDIGLRKLSCAASSSSSKGPVPVTIVAGSHSSGKTMLINQILLSDSKKIGVVYDKPMEEVYSFFNECRCGVVREDILKRLVELLSKKPLLQHIIIEVEGNLVPVINSIYANQIADKVELDGVVLMLSAENLESKTEMHDMMHADRVVINEVDSLHEGDLSVFIDNMQIINPFALIKASRIGEIEPSFILDIRRHDLQRIDMEMQRLNYDPRRDPEFDGVGHDKGCVQLVLRQELKRHCVAYAVGALLSEHADKICQFKGIFSLRKNKKQFLVQATWDFVYGDFGREWGETERINNMILVGKNLRQIDFESYEYIMCM